MKKLLSFAAIASLFVASQASAIVWQDTDTPVTYISEYNGGASGTLDITPGYNPLLHVINSAKIGFAFADDWWDVDEYVDIIVDGTEIFSDVEVSGSIFSYDWKVADITGTLLGNLSVDGKLNYSVTVNDLKKWYKGTEDTWLKKVTLTAHGDERQGGGNAVPDTGSSLALLGLGLLGLVGLRRRFSK